MHKKSIILGSILLLSACGGSELDLAGVGFNPFPSFDIPVDQITARSFADTNTDLTRLDTLSAGLTRTAIADLPTTGRGNYTGVFETSTTGVTDRATDQLAFTGDVNLTVKLECTTNCYLSDSGRVSSLTGNVVDGTGRAVTGTLSFGGYNYFDTTDDQSIRGSFSGSVDLPDGGTQVVRALEMGGTLRGTTSEVVSLTGTGDVDVAGSGTTAEMSVAITADR